MSFADGKLLHRSYPFHVLLVHEVMEGTILGRRPVSMVLLSQRVTNMFNSRPFPCGE